jgi:hypothetical protein
MKEEKEEEYFPKIAVVADDSKIKAAGEEFYKVLGMGCLGMRICSLEEAIEQKLPLREAQSQYIQKIPHDVVICKGVDELIPEDYQDPQIPVHLDSVVFKSDKTEVEVDIGVQTQKNNEVCACGSGKKYKKCCRKKDRELQSK